MADTKQICTLYGVFDNDKLLGTYDSPEAVSIALKQHIADAVECALIFNKNPTEKERKDAKEAAKKRFLIHDIGTYTHTWNAKE